MADEKTTPSSTELDAETRANEKLTRDMEKRKKVLDEIAKKAKEYGISMKDIAKASGQVQKEFKGMSSVAAGFYNRLDSEDTFYCRGS